MALFYLTTCENSEPKVQPFSMGAFTLFATSILLSVFIPFSSFSVVQMEKSHSELSSASAHHKRVFAKNNFVTITSFELISVGALLFLNFRASTVAIQPDYLKKDYFCCMSENQNKKTEEKPMVLLLIVLNAIVLEQGFISDEKWYWLLLITIPLLLIALFF